MPFQVFQTESRSILSPTTGFIAQAGFTHSLSPARNCTFGCSYCYVPTMGIYGGLQPSDWQHWGHFTTFKENAPALLRKSLRPDQIIYCSPLVDPYQPVEAEQQLMPRILQVLLEQPPKIFVIQTRGPLIVRDMPLLAALAKRTCLRVSFSLTTNREPVRRIYEPHCASIAERLTAIAKLRSAGIAVHATLAPILPCDPEQLAALALDSTDTAIIGDPLHLRVVKKHGATTRKAAVAISLKHRHSEWFDPGFQASVVSRIAESAAAAGRPFATGPEGFSWLAQ